MFISLEFTETFAELSPGMEETVRKLGESVSWERQHCWAGMFDGKLRTMGTKPFTKW